MAQNLKLTEATRKGDIEVVGKLLEDGADVNEKDKGGWTPLQWAAWCGHIEVVETLLEAGHCRYSTPIAESFIGRRGNRPKPKP